METKSDGKYKIAVVGAGYWGKNLVRNFYNLGVLDTVCETSPLLREQISRQYSGVSLESDYREVLQKDIKGVAISTPAATHYSLAKEALLHGKDVYVEKPLCLDEAEAEDLCHIAEKNNRILMVGHLLQYHPAVKVIKDYIRDGRMGRLHHIYSNRLNLGIFRAEENVLWSFAPHDISVILSFLNKMPERVFANGTASLRKGIYDSASVTMEFQGGIRAEIFVSWLHPFKEQRMVLVGENGMLVFDDRSQDEKLKYYEGTVLWDGDLPKPNKTEPSVLPLLTEEPLKNECMAFIEAIKSRKNPLTNGWEGLSVLKVLNAAQRSMDAGGQWQSMNKVGKRDYFVHPTAFIDDDCTIGNGTKIWHFSHIMAGAEVGDGCNIGQNVVISPGVKMGRNVKVQNNVSVYTGVICEDDVFLGPSMVFTNVKTPRSHVSRKEQYSKTILRRGCSVGANATIICGVEIGKYAMVGAGSVVTKDVPPYTLVVGNPARQIGFVCQCGERVEPGEQCQGCGKHLPFR